MESCATKKGARKLVSSNVAKILEKEKVAIKIRETCEKTMFTPSNPNEATNPIVTAYRQGCCQIAKREFSNNRSSDCQQEFSDICLLDHKQRFNDKRREIANDQNDA